MNLKNFFRNLKVKLICLVSGHIAFQTTGTPASFFQPRTVGNKYRVLHFCDRCGAAYTTLHELTKEELEAEEKYLKTLELARVQAEKELENQLSKVLDATLSKDGKLALN